MDLTFWSVILRTGQIAIESSTTLFCGLLVAGIMRRMLGGTGLRRLFGGPGYWGLFRAWGIGTLLPVCSLGVIPIAREMRRAGVPSGTILAFVLAAPHINPLSLLYGLTLSEPLTVVCFAIGSMFIALLAGGLWDRLFALQQDTAPSDDEPMPAPGLKRLAAVTVAAGREAVSPAMAYVLLAIFFTGLLAGLLPFGCLGMTMQHSDLFSPILMTVIALPAYMGPLQGMMRVGMMFEHGNSSGAAFILFELGIGLNVGLIVWLMTLFGWRRILVWLGLIPAVALSVAYAADHFLYFAEEEVSHTHAFDEWTSPFTSGSAVGWQVVRDKLLLKVELLEALALAGLLFLVVLGLLVKQLDRQGRLEVWLAKPPPVSNRPPSIWNRNIPGPVLGMIALVGLVLFSVVALYIYYPPPQVALNEITRVRADAVVAVIGGHKEEAIRQIEKWDLLTRKLQVGVFLRTGEMDPYVWEVTDDLRERLEELRDSLLAGKVDEAREMLPKVEEAYRKCRAAY